MVTRIAQYAILEKLYESDDVFVYRGYRIWDRLSVILKALRREAATQVRLAQLRHEFDIISKLDAPGVVKTLALEGYDDSLVMVLHDIGGVSLDQILEMSALPIVDFLELAIAVVDAVGLIHSKHIIHKDINPSNIIYNPATKEINLIDFDLADEMPEQSITAKPPTAIEGTLEYISPEQTGRMNRPVDYRTDFYSLGVTFYQMLTGELPFEAEDALGMVHNHIAKIPSAPHELNAAIPEMISRIVMKLLSKAADDRYQSAWGLNTDLKKCLSQIMENQGVIREFELGLDDFSNQLRIPHKLYGRHREITRLVEALDRVSGGEHELMLVAGYAGVGKTALVHEIYGHVTKKSGYFIEGKFDQLQRNVPYFAWIQAFTGFVNYLLMESEEQLAQWKQTITQAVGSAGKVLTDVIPSLELVIGTQPDIPALGPAESQNRFNYVFLEFIKAIAIEGHPLVVFLDDLQWIEDASLNLLHSVLTTNGIANILIIGAYRDNEVGTLHPLTRMIEKIRDEKADVGLLTLKGLSETTVNELIADTLHRSKAQTVELTQLIYLKTRGNPFFVHQMLNALVEKRAIYFDGASKSWQWEIALLRGMEITDNVVTLMLGKIRSIPSETQHILPLAASMGSQFRASQLNIIAGETEEVVLKELQPALREGLIISQDDNYRFVHDRIQQAAYSLIPDAEKKKVHLEIGRLLLQHLQEKEREQQLFTIVDHFNVGAELIASAEEKTTVANLNLRAGLKARASAAFSAAAKYFNAGVFLLGAENWSSQYELMTELYTQAAEASGLVGDFAETNRLFNEIVQHAQRPVDMIGAYMSRMMVLSAEGRLPEFMDCALEILDKLGIHINPNPDATDIQNTLAEVRSMYDPNNIEALVNLPKNINPVEMQIMRVLGLAQNSAYSGRPDLFALFALESVKRTVMYGIAAESMHSFCHLGLLLCGLPGGDIDEGYQFGMLASALAEKNITSSIAPRVLAVTVGMIWSYKRHLQDTIDTLEPLYARLKEFGDFEYAGYVLCWRDSNALLSARELIDLEKEMSEHHKDMQGIRAEVGLRWHAPFWQATLNLLGRAEYPWVVNGEVYDRPTMLQAIEETGNLAAQTALHVNTIALCYLFERYEEALDASAMAEKSRAGMVAMPIEPVWYFYDSLTRLALYSRVSESERQAFLERVTANQEYLGLRAHHAPMNYLHKWHLVEGEKARALGDVGKAIEHYDRAISLAHDNGYNNEEAIANEIAARYWLEMKKDDFARIHISKAYWRYSDWQAFAKVKALEEKYPRWLKRETEARPERRSETRRISDRITGALDIDTAMKAASAISSEIEFDKLINTMTHIIVENAGAQSGYLLLEKNGIWQVAAKGEINTEEIETPLPVGVDESDLVARSVVRFVTRTKESIVLDDAANRSEFTNDPHIRREKTKSLLCTPLLSRSKLIGVMYLENNLTTQAFTPERVQFLRLLLSQAAISLENAQVYEALRDSEELNRLTLSNITDAVFVTDDAGSFIYICPNVNVIFRYSFHEVHALGNIDYLLGKELFSPAELKASHRLINIEREVIDKAGRSHALLVNVVTVSIKGGTRLYICRDITDRKQAEDALQKSEERYRSLIIKMRTAVVLHDGQGRILISNPLAQHLLGLTEDQLLGRKLIDPEWHFLNEDGSIMPVEEYPVSRVLNSRQPLRDFVAGIHKPRRNEIIWVLINAEPEYNDVMAIERVIVSFVDITKRMLAEDALRKSEAEYRRLVETANEGIWMLGPDALTTFVNAQMAEMLGYAPEEMIGRPVTDFMYEEDSIDHMHRMENRQLGKSEHFERRFRKKNGQTVWTLISATPILDREGRFRGAFGMHTDITEHKQFEVRQRDFYRRTILAATDGKLDLIERESIEKIAGPAEAVFWVENAEGFRDVRVAVMKIARFLGIDEIRAADYRTAVGEAITNATKHANGGKVSIHALPTSILTVISDRGPGIEAMSIPEVALKKGYTTTGTLGMGYKVMTSIADKVYLATGSWGTTVGVEMNIEPPETKLDISEMYHV
jgi:PAS domain S-box-containing protein